MVIFSTSSKKAGKFKFVHFADLPLDDDYLLQYGPLLRWILESDPTLRAKRVHGALRFHRRKLNIL